MAVLRRGLPASEPQIARRLIAAGLARGPVPLTRIEKAARFCSLRLPCHILRRPGLVVAVRPGTERLAHAAYGIASRMIVHWGMARIGRIAYLLESRDHPFITAVVSAKREFRWIDSTAGWFWFESPSNTLVREIARVLSVAQRLRPQEIADVVFRRWPPDNVPTARAVETLCRQVPRFRVDAKIVSLADPKSPTDALSAREEELVRVFREHGPELAGDRLYDLAATLAIDLVELNRLLRRCPFVLEARPGVFRLAGS